MSRRTHKIRRRGPGVFNKRRKKIVKNCMMTVVALLVVASGFFVTQYMVNNVGLHVADPSSSTPSSATATADSSGTTANNSVSTTTTTKPAVSDADGSLRAFYLTIDQLRDRTKLDTQLDNATAAGFNAVLFDLKSEDGVVHYASATALAQQAKSIADDAVTLDDIKSIMQHIKEKGLIAIPRLFAFKDPVSPFNLPSAKVLLADNPAYTWLDNSKDKGGKPWLNPYAFDAHKYIIDLAKELTDAGCKALMLDGVQFPNQTSSSYYGNSELTSLSQIAVLQKFIKDLSTSVGSGCRVIQSMPGLSTLGDGTEPFGGNPVTFGANTVAPVLMPSTLGSKLSVGENSLSDPASSPYDAVKLAAGQVKLRLELITAADRPVIMPWLQAYDYSSTQVKQQMQAVNEILGSDASYILYHTSGSYDFASLK